MRVLIPVVLALLHATVAAADTALLIANDRYDSAPDLRGGGEIAALEAPLTEAGFEVIVVENGPVAAMRAAASALLEAEETGRVLIAVSGHVARSGRGTWLLGRDADNPDLGTAGAAGLALDTLLEIAARAPARAIVLLGREARRIDLGPGLRRGIGPISAPQGVTVISGAPGDLADFARRSVLRPGSDLAAALAGSRVLRSHGFLSPAVPFLPGDAAPASALPAPSEEEAALWAAAVELGTEGAYRAYLDRYPDGAFAEQARGRLGALGARAADPAARAEATEAALALTRAQRRQVQRDLTRLDFDPRGIDGIFGPGTRAAIRSWQAARGFEVTGFLTRPQLSALREAGAQRAAELEEEARRQREAEARADRAFWQAGGQGRDEAALRAYLERYPDGLFAEVARARLDEIEADRLSEAEAEEREIWEDVRHADTVDAYRRYLELYPGGQFASTARSRIAVLETGLTPRALSQAQAREAALNLTGQMRRLAERRLDGLGYRVGRVDGAFDANTRAAIRAYQRDRGVQATGYLDQGTVVRLLAEAIGGRIFE